LYWKKSHGLIGSLKKYSNLLDMELMMSFKPREEVADTTYNKVTDLYDKVFQDIKSERMNGIGYANIFLKAIIYLLQILGAERAC